MKIKSEVKGAIVLVEEMVEEGKEGNMNVQRTCIQHNIGQQQWQLTT